jgi:glutaredoxin
VDPDGVTTARITLIGRPGCHLCDDAREIIERVAADSGTEWEELSVLDDEDLLDRYAEQIPVVLVDGEQHTFWKVDESRLRAAVGGERRWFRRERTVRGG